MPRRHGRIVHPKKCDPLFLAARQPSSDHVQALSADLRVQRSPLGGHRGGQEPPRRGSVADQSTLAGSGVVSGQAHFVPVCPLFFLYACMEKRRLNLREFAETAVALGVRPNTLRVWRQRECIPPRWALKFYEHFGGPVEISDWVPDPVSSIERPRTLADIASTFINRQRG